MERRNKVLGISILAIVFLVVTLAILSASHLPVQCNDGIDNDLDGKIDFPDDNGCVSGTDRTESLKLGYADGCLTKGDKLKDIFGNLNYECSSTLCKVCVLMTETGNWTTNPKKCNKLVQCGFNNGEGSGGNVELDVTPPVLTINNPIQDTVYNSRKVLVDFEVNEKADVYYTDLNTGRGRWIRVCSNCQDYSRERGFEEGLNELSFRVKDVVGNKAFFNVSFIIDSQEPRIKKTSPTSGFVNTILFVEFDEENPVDLEVHYGNLETGFVVEQLDLVLDCTQDDDEWMCEKNVSLTAYDEQDIEYWFVVTDIAGNTDESKHYILSVDETNPVINNPDSFFEVDGRYVYFSINITEKNLDEVGYNYIDDRGRLKEKRLCSKLKGGICEKKISFRDGTYNLTVYVLDEAGNSMGIGIEFFIDSKNPKIKKTLPTRGFASGDFYVEFQEENPDELFLYYGTEEDLRTLNVDLENDCESIKGKSDKQACDVSVNLTDYNGQEIEYWFGLNDTVGGEDESRHYELDVDTQYPVVNNLESFFEVDGRRVYFSINITEENLDEVTYNYIDDRDRLKEKRLCSRLRDGLCEKRVSFREGEYALTIQITDEAGNSIGILASFEVIK